MPRTMPNFVLALTAICAAGCGTEGDSFFSGQRFPAVAPWQDLGPLTICEAETRLGPDTSEPLGLCFDLEAPACASDATCASRERCVCGRCQIPLCTSGDECPAGWTCNFAAKRCDRSCAENSDCLTGEFCPPGEKVCRGTCSSDAASPCQQGELCQDGRCTVQLCASDAACHGRGFCAMQRRAAHLREPSPLAVAPGMVIWLERLLQDQAAIWRAVSSDGIHFRFEPTEPVITPEASDGARAGAPSVQILENGSYLAIFANAYGELRQASSQDGVHFLRAKETLLAPAWPWQQSGLDAPSLVAAPQGGWLLYYSTAARDAIGLATSADGRNFSSLPTPVLTKAMIYDPVLWRDIDALGSPCAEAARDPAGQPFVRLFFTARGLESGPTIEFGTPLEPVPNFSVGEASSLDGTNWVAWPYNPVFDRIENFVAHTSELDPATVSWAERRLLYYRYTNANETRPSQLGVAQSPVNP